MEEFGVKVVADASDFAKELNGAKKDAVAFAGSLEKSVGQGTASVVKGTGAATNSIVNFGRILQDSAYGPQGFANNLNPFFEGLSRVREESKLTGKSVTTLLVSSLAGGGGLSLAISAVTAALSFAAVGLQFYGKKTKDAAKETKSYVESLNDISRASLLGSQAATTETLKLQLLYRAATDTTASTKLRGDAINKLQELYPAYFKNIQDETIATGGAKDAYERLTKAILEASKAKAAQDIVSTNQKRQLEDDQKINDLLIERDKLDARIAKNRKFLEQNSRAIGAGVGASNTEGIQRTIASIENERLGIQRQINDLTTDHTILNKRNLDLVNKIYDAGKKTNDIGVYTGEGIGAVGKELADTFKKVDTSKFKTGTFAGSIVSEADLRTINDTVTATGNLAKVMTDSYEARVADEALQLKMNQNLTIANSLTGSLANLFEQGFSGGNFFQNLIQGLGQLIIKLLATLAAAAAVAAVLSLIPGFQIFGSTSGALGFQGLFKGLSGIGSGVGALGSIGSLFQAAPQSQNLSQANLATIQISGSLRGQDIVLSGQRTLGSQRRIG